MELFEAIKQSKALTLFEAARPEDVEDCQKRLCSAGAAPMPVSYAKFLQQTNGIFGGEVSVFGVEAGEPCEDVYAKNTIAGANSPTMVFLGVSLMQYLCYDWRQKAYTVIDKAGGQTVLLSPFLNDALGLFLRDYI